MYTFVVNDTVSGLLVPLSALIERMRLDNVAFWRFRQITMGHGHPFGMTVAEFEAASRSIPAGHEVRETDFRAFLKSDFQIIDGEIEAWSNHVPPTCVLRLDCEDATQWELTTDHPELATQLERAGFRRA